jgi:hypothetical protein
MKIALLLFFALSLLSCGGGNVENKNRIEKSVPIQDSLSYNEKRYNALAGIRYSYQLDSLLEESDLFETPISYYVKLFGFDDIYKVKIDSTEKYGIVFNESSPNGKLIFDLLTNQNNVNRLLNDSTINIVFKINKFKKLNYLVTGEVDGEYGVVDINGEEAPILINGEIVEIK